jgi:hypothetical protein
LNDSIELSAVDDSPTAGGDEVFLSFSSSSVLTLISAIFSAEAVTMTTDNRPIKSLRLTECLALLYPVNHGWL